MALRYNLKPGQVIQLKKPGTIAIDKINGKLVAFINTSQNEGVKIHYRTENGVALGAKKQNQPQ